MSPGIGTAEASGLGRVAVALDTNERETFERWCAFFGPRVGVLKVGLEAFVRWGPPAIESARRHAQAIFLDLKLHDIPNTVAGAVRSARELEVDYLTIHAAGGPAMIAAAAEAAEGRVALLERLVRSVRNVTAKPIAVKLSPNVTSPAAIGEAAKAGGADILSAINTVLGMAIDPWTRRPRLHTTRGGLSGPAIKPIAVRIVYDVAKKVGLPVIGIGGVETVDDVIEFLLAGASAVQVGTALFRNPRAAEQLVDGLAARLVEMKVERVTELVGAVRPWRE